MSVRLHRFCVTLYMQVTISALTYPSMSHTDSFRNAILIANNAHISVKAILLSDNTDISACTNISRVVWNHDLEYVVNCDRRSPREEDIPNDREVYRSDTKRYLWKCY